MSDLLAIGVILLLAGATLGLIKVCDRLTERES